MLQASVQSQQYYAFSVNKQINDKERITAAMENPSLREIVEECIKEID